VPGTSSIGVVIADTSFLIRKGLRSLIDESPDLNFLADVANAINLFEIIKDKNPHVLIVDHCCDDCFSLKVILKIKNTFPTLNILVISHEKSLEEIRKVLDMGIKNFLLKDCDEHEMLEAIIACSNGEKYFCSQIIDVLLENEISSPKQHEIVHVTEREFEIITLLVTGNRPKEIAHKLSISPLTVNTHKKNIYKKLGINHSFELAQYALKTGIMK
jgi:DNA-binding NarL/FixJ family response regulator